MEYGISAGAAAFWPPATLVVKERWNRKFDRLRRAILGDGHTSACFDQTSLSRSVQRGVCDGGHREGVMEESEAKSANALSHGIAGKNGWHTGSLQELLSASSLL